MWVKSEYAGELAVLSAWVSLLVPWNIVYHTKAPLESTVYFLRFALFEIQFRAPSEITLNATDVGRGVQQVDVEAILAQQYPGTNLVGDFFLTTPPTSALFYETSRLQQAGWVWTVGALCFFAAFVLSLALYFREEAVSERLPLSEVRLMGALLGVGALGTLAATVLYYLQRSVVGFPIPIGALIIGFLAVVLLQTERVNDDATE